jgi:hypothetical protein
MRLLLPEGRTNMHSAQTVQASSCSDTQEINVYGTLRLIAMYKPTLSVSRSFSELSSHLFLELSRLSGRYFLLELTPKRAVHPCEGLKL